MHGSMDLRKSIGLVHEIANPMNHAIVYSMFLNVGRDAYHNGLMFLFFAVQIMVKYTICMNYIAY